MIFNDINMSLKTQLRNDVTLYHFHIDSQGNLEEKQKLTEALGALPNNENHMKILQ